MNLTLREFRVFRVVYELRSFSGASEAVHMTQSAVSKVCQEMEAKVGQRLFERSTRKVIPTQLAHQLYGYVCEVLGTMDAAERSLRSLLNMEAGEVSVASSPMMSVGLLKGPIAEFHDTYPAIRIAMHELSTDETIEYVANSKADFGLVSMEKVHPKLTAEHLYNETMLAVCAPEHELARSENVTWEILAKFPQISLHSTFSTRRTIDHVFTAKHLTSLGNIEVGTVLSAIGLAKAGLGITVLPCYVREFVSDLGLVTRPLPDVGVSHSISLITRWNARLSAPAENLLNSVKRALSSA